MHGYYGALFLSKWANGVVENGVDCGVADAMKVWSYELRRYDAKTVLEAIGRCKTAHPEYPPSLPQFVALCEAVKPREVFKAPAHVGGTVRGAQQGGARKVAPVARAHSAGCACVWWIGAVVRNTLPTPRSVLVATNRRAASVGRDGEVLIIPPP